MWLHVGPKQAIIHTFLMHEILAFSALHMAYVQPDQRKAYYALGIHHQDLSIRGTRRVLHNIAEDNAPAVFATSMLVTLTVFAARGLDAMDPGPNTQSAIDDLIDIFALIQGIGGVIASSQMLVINGPFGPLFRDPVYEIPPQPLFAELLEHIPPLVHFIEHQPDIEDDMRRELLEMITFLRNTTVRSMRPCMDNREVRFLFWWPLHLSPNYFTWLRQRHSAALIILVHYATVFYVAEPLYWFMTGWAERVSRSIVEAIDPSWQVAIQWPLQYMEAVREARHPPPPQEPGIEGAAL